MPAIDLSDSTFKLVNDHFQMLRLFQPSLSLDEMIRTLLDRVVNRADSVPSPLVTPPPSSSQTPPSQQSVQIRGGRRIYRVKKRTSKRSDYAKAIIETLREQGGRLSTQDLQPLLFKRLERDGIITEHEKERLRGGDLRWWVEARFARRSLVVSGHLKGNGVHGVWELAEHVHPPPQATRAISKPLPGPPDANHRRVRESTGAEEGLSADDQIQICLEYLEQAGGFAPMRELYGAVEAIISPVRLSESGQSSLRNFINMRAVQQGLVELDTARRGWRITESGRRRLASKG